MGAFSLLTPRLLLPEATYYLVLALDLDLEMDLDTVTLLCNFLTGDLDFDFDLSLIYCFFDDSTTVVLEDFKPLFVAPDLALD